MSTAGGPKLYGIGRGGDSDIVLCMDAHDAGSYPGEPTTNLFPQPSLASSAVGSTWSGANGVWGTSTATVEKVIGPDGKYIKAVSNQHTASGGGTANIWFFYDYLSGMGSAQRNLTLTNGTAYTCSWWWKATESRSASSNSIYFISPAYSTGGAPTVTTEWTKAYVYFTFGGTTGTYRPGHYFYSVGNSTAVGFKVWYAMLQIEEKTYGTPAVRNQLSGFGQQGYNARPASTNLMIHGNVDDSFPNLISEALSKFETSSGWTLFGNFTINSSTEVAEVTNSSGTNLLQRGYSPAQITAGERYRVTGDVTTTAGTLKTRVGDGSYSVLATGVGSSVEVVAGSTTTETVLFWADGWKGTLDNVGVSVAPPFEDSSPSKHTITANGNVTHSGGQSKFSGGSIYFDGTGDYLDVAASTGFAFGTGDFTVDAFVYTDNTTADSFYRRIYMTDGPTGNGATNPQLAIVPTTGLANAWSTSGSLDLSSTTNVADGAWHHIAMVRSSGTVTLYVDGASEATQSWTENVALNSGSPRPRIGSYDGSAGDFDGYIDEIRVTAGTALWTHAFTPPTRRNLNGPVVDLSGHDNAGNFATTDMTDVKTYQKGQVIEPVTSAVWDFDGTDDIIDLGNINYNSVSGLTVATWIKSTNYGLNDTFMSSWGDDSNSNYAWLLFKSQWVSDKVDWLVSSGGTSYTRCAGATALTDNLWYYVVGTWNPSGAMVLYINGVQDGTATGPTSIKDNDFNTFIGCDSDGGSESKIRFFRGEMGNATVWGTTLTAAQVKQNFNSQRSRFKV